MVDARPWSSRTYATRPRVVGYQRSAGPTAAATGGTPNLQKKSTNTNANKNSNNDVISVFVLFRPTQSGEEDSQDDVASGDEGEGEVEGGLVREGIEEWKSARLNCSWQASLRRFQEMVRAGGAGAFFFFFLRVCIFWVSFFVSRVGGVSVMCFCCSSFVLAHVFFV